VELRENLVHLSCRSTGRGPWACCHQAERMADNHLGRPVPGEDVPTPAEDEGQLSGQAVHHEPKRLTDVLRTQEAPLPVPGGRTRKKGDVARGI
jgi:hypothetical protein